MNLDTIHDLVARAAAPGEAYGLMIASVGRVYRVRAVIGGEVVAHGEARDLEHATVAVTETLEEMLSAASLLDACGE